MFFLKRWRKFLWEASIFCMNFIALDASANDEVVSGKGSLKFEFELAARNKVGGDSGGEIRLFRLDCGLGGCLLNIFSMNNCVMNKGGRSSFSPDVQQYSTQTGDLKVDELGNGGYRLTVYQAVHHKLPAYIVFALLDEKDSPARLLSFEARDFIDMSLFPQHISKVEYVPLIGENLISMDCPVAVQGLAAHR